MQINQIQFQPFGSLPNETLNKTFSFLSLEDLAATSQVSKRCKYISEEIMDRRIAFLWKDRLLTINNIPRRAQQKLELIHSYLDHFGQEERHQKLGRKIQQFVREYIGFPNEEFDSFIDLNNPHWKFILRGQLEKLDLVYRTIHHSKNLRFNIKEDMKESEWDAIDAIIGEFPIQTNRLVLKLNSDTAPSHAAPLKLPLKLFEQSNCIDEMGVTLSQRFAFSTENLTQISQLVHAKQQNPNALNINTLILTFHHVDSEKIFDFIRTFEYINQPLNIAFCQIFGTAETCSGLHYKSMHLEYLAREVSSELKIQLINMLEVPYPPRVIEIHP